MFCIYSHNTDPYYNLASEEHYLRNSADEYFILWKSVPSVICGKHQNVLSEINYPFLRQKGILVARRLTGGGTVYHDEGNINFTFIRNGEPGKLVDFTSFISPVIRFLKTLNLQAVQGPKHEILVNGLKVSGNAEHVFRNRVLHHGTLLFQSDLEVLNRAITRENGSYSDKAVQSNRSTVTNLAACLNGNINIDTFCSSLFDFIKSDCGGSDYDPTEHIKTISELADLKYRSAGWIFGWSPDYIFRNTMPEFGLTIELTVHRGFITKSLVSSPVLPDAFVKAVNEGLQGVQHTELPVRRILESAGLNEIIAEGEKTRDFVLSFF
jgi:lipoate-protein ligase A